MKTLILLLSFIVFCASCADAPLEFEPEKSQIETDSIIVLENVLIELNESIQFNWDNSTSQIIEDDLWDRLKGSYENNKRALIHLVNNKEPTQARVCNVHGEISKGQMAFIVLDQMEDIPYAQVFKFQYCVVDPSCPYIGGLIESIDSNDKAYRQLMVFFKNTFKSDN
ncbi:MAG: hypothetical protein GQ574_02760 [Crocinitomix sp.]|nr:hypothetical protein [Crocinitomix sp.]